jgi:hypothetical protein
MNKKTELTEEEKNQVLEGLKEVKENPYSKEMKIYINGDGTITSKVVDTKEGEEEK